MKIFESRICVQAGDYYHSSVLESSVHLLQLEYDCKDRRGGKIEKKKS